MTNKIQIPINFDQLANILDQPLFNPSTQLHMIMNTKLIFKANKDTLEKASIFVNRKMSEYRVSEHDRLVEIANVLSNVPEKLLKSLNTNQESKQQGFYERLSNLNSN